MEHINRTYVYRPATYWSQWVFLGGILEIFLALLAAYHSWQYAAPTGEGLVAVRDSLWYVLPLAFIGGFSMSKGYLDYAIASGFHLFLGDRGFVNMDSLEMRHPVLAQNTFPVNLDEQKRFYHPLIHGKRVTRYEVWRWGRKGGVWKWPKWDGGKREGYWSAIQHSWDVADVSCKSCPKCDWPEVRRPDLNFCPSCGFGLAAINGIIPILNFCPECGDGGIKATKPKMSPKVVAGKPLPVVSSADSKGRSAFVLAPEVSESLRTKLPGPQRGRTLDLRYVIWPDRSPLELPEEVTLQIMGDTEFRASSLVDVGYDLLPEEVHLGTVLPPNALARLWGNEVILKETTAELLNAREQLAFQRQLLEMQYGGGMSGVSGPTTGQQPK